LKLHIQVGSSEMVKDESYQGFEQGPIRPPSEAYSLLIRVTRNCPWNRCTFCPVYKGSRFSIRSVDHVKKDIDAIHTSVEMIRNMADEFGRIHRTEIREGLKIMNNLILWPSTPL